MAIESWKGLTPEVHYSCQSLTKDKKGAHSESIDVESLLDLLDRTADLKYDIMLEVKDTNSSAEKIIEMIGG